MGGAGPLELLARQAPGFGLDRALHLDPEIYRLELERIWRPAWLFAAHTAELRRPGAVVVFDVGDDSLLIVRGEDGQARAFHNVCRHRGTRLVEGPAPGPEAPGAAAPGAFLRCPYHQWAYRFDGSLAACGGMDRVEGLDVSAHGLLPVECAELGGLVFVRPEPPAGTAPDKGRPDIYELAPPVSPQGLARAKVAHRQAYLVGAGWKIVWENNRECWHCHLGHPEYVKSHFDTADITSPKVRDRIDRRTQAMVAALAGLPMGEVHDVAGLARFPSPGPDWSAHRTPLVEGFSTESLDGAAIAPLMGDYQSYEVGVLRLRALPNFWCHGSADHAVTTRLAPAGVDRTEVVVTWLVDEDAVEGRDYSLERLLPFGTVPASRTGRCVSATSEGCAAPPISPARCRPGTRPTWPPFTSGTGKPWPEMTGQGCSARP